MSNGDAGVPSEVGQTTVERDLGKELAKAAEVGRIVLGVTKERTENPQFRVRKYTFPMLDQRSFSPETVGAIVTKKETVTDDGIKAAKEASVTLAVESAVQIVRAKPTTNQVVEDSDSLEQMARMLNRGAGLVIQMETEDPQAVVKAGRAALESRKRENGLEEADNWDDQKVIAWTKDVFRKAGSRLKNSIEAIEAYHRR